MTLTHLLEHIHHFAVHQAEVAGIDGDLHRRIGVDQPVEEPGADALDGLGDGLPMRNLVVNGLLHSSEVTLPAKGSVSDPRAYIVEQFTRLLGREPNAYELAGFADAWDRDPAVGPRTIIRAIIGSREYQSQ